MLSGEFNNNLKAVSASKKDHYSVFIFVNTFLELDIGGNFTFLVSRVWNCRTITNRDLKNYGCGYSVKILLLLLLKVLKLSLIFCPSRNTTVCNILWKSNSLIAAVLYRPWGKSVLLPSLKFRAAVHEHLPESLFRWSGNCLRISFRP